MGVFNLVCDIYDPVTYFSFVLWPGEGCFYNYQFSYLTQKSYFSSKEKSSEVKTKSVIWNLEANELRIIAVLNILRRIITTRSLIAITSISKKYLGNFKQSKFISEVTVTPSHAIWRCRCTVLFFKFSVYFIWHVWRIITPKMWI